MDSIKKDIDDTIDAVDRAIAGGYVPTFEPREAWHSMPEYAKYLDFAQLTPVQIEEKLKNEYPDAYAKLKGLV